MNKETTIHIPANNSQNEWFKMANSLIDIEEPFDKLIVDFNSVKFLEVDHLVVLACLLETFHSKGAKISFRGGTKKLNHHLHNIKFKNYWKEGFDRSTYTQSLNNTTLCLWNIQNEKIDSYSTYARAYFEGFTKNKDLIPLATNMNELFNNIFDHADSKIGGYIITQYYKKSNIISFSVCDLGVGIAKSVNSFLGKSGQKPLKDHEAIYHALKVGFTAKSTPQNRGLGLYHISNLIESCDGSLLIKSNRGFLVKKSDNYIKLAALDVPFSGTLIKVKVYLDYFDNKEDEEIIADF